MIPRRLPDHLISPDQSDPAIRAISAEIASTPLSGQVWHGELVSRRKDGSTFADEMTITPVRDQSGDVTHFVAIRQDVSERKAAEARLAASSDFTQHVIDAVADPIFVKDERHRWILGNQAFWDLLGAGPDALLGKSDYDVLPAEQASIFWEKDDLVLRTGQTNENEEPITDSHGAKAGRGGASSREPRARGSRGTRPGAGRGGVGGRPRQI
jgi:PAS domain-containing protein